MITDQREIVKAVAHADLNVALKFSLINLTLRPPRGVCFDFAGSALGIDILPLNNPGVFNDEPTHTGSLVLFGSQPDAYIVNSGEYIVHAGIHIGKLPEYPVAIWNKNGLNGSVNITTPEELMEEWDAAKFWYYDP